MRKTEKKLCLRWTGIILLMLLSLCGMSVQAGGKQEEIKEESQGRVLFISSYSYAWDTVQNQIEGIKSKIPADVVIDYEFMDTKRVDDEISKQQFYEGLSYRLSQVAPYDVVILGDDAALVFAAEYQQELFEGIPLVFESVNDEELGLELAKDPYITGVLETASVEKNIEFGLRLNPNAKRMVAILDDSITGEAERKRFYRRAEAYPELEFTEINTSHLTTNELKRALRQVEKDSILIYALMTEDASGKQYTNQEAVRLITDSVSVPAIRMVEGGIGEGLLGGHVVSMYKSGQIAASMAMDIIHGKECKDIEVIKESPNIYYVDEKVMEKFGLDMSLVPKGATIVNHNPSFSERNREALVPSVMIILVPLGIILWGIYDNSKRRKLLTELEEARGIMEDASQHDFLTGLPNRSKFIKDLESLIAEKVPCTVMMLDIDDFKEINDTYGHGAGDAALKQLAGRMKEMQSQILTSYRFAGDEFIIIVKSRQSKLVEQAAYQCRQLFAKPFVLAGKNQKVCGSIGVASYPAHAPTAEQLIGCADKAMYHVKKSGKNNFAFYKADEKNMKVNEIPVS